MLNYYSLCRRPRVFRSIVGVSVEEFRELYKRFEPAWIAAEKRRLKGRNERQRAVGAGRDYKLDNRDHLLMVLIWLRQYPTTAALGYMFGLSQATASRNSRRVLGVMKEICQDEFRWPEPPKKYEGRTLNELRLAYPDTFAIIDATEQPVERPKDREKEHLHYSGKRRRPTCKNSIVVTEHGIIRGVTDSVPGRTHDLTHIRKSGLLARIPQTVEVLADAGYDGLYKDMPNHNVITSFKPQRDHPLSEEQKLMNREMSATRIIVENVFCEMKHFRSLYDCFRHDVAVMHSAVFMVIAAIVNRRIECRLEVAGVC